MKKFLIGSLMVVVGITAFGKGYHHREVGRHHQQHCEYSRPDEKRDFRMNPEFEKTRIEFDEKRLEIRKELLKDTPDWAKVQKLNEEIALKKAEFRTNNMKRCFEYRKSLPTTNNTNNTK